MQDLRREVWELCLLVFVNLGPLYPQPHSLSLFFIYCLILVIISDLNAL